MARSEPLITLLRVIQELRAVHPSQHGVSLEEVAEACEVTTRTVRRKLRALEDAGFHILKSRDIGGKARYRLDTRTLAIIGQRFELDEITALCVASAVLQDGDGLKVRAKIHSVFDKVVNSVPPLLRQRALRRAEVVTSEGAWSKVCDRYARVVTQLVDAISERWPVQLTLKANDGAPGSVRFDPHVLHCADGVLCVIGRPHHDDKLCVLSLECVEGLQPLQDERFSPLWCCDERT